jgi:hypothetical protein
MDHDGEEGLPSANGHRCGNGHAHPRLAVAAASDTVAEEPAMA